MELARMDHGVTGVIYRIAPLTECEQFIFSPESTSNAVYFVSLSTLPVPNFNLSSE